MIRITEKGYKTMMEDFKRPDHPDFMTSSELKKIGWSGIRHNALTEEQELWTDGDLRLAISTRLIALNPRAWDEKYEEIFKLYNVKTI